MKLDIVQLAICEPLNTSYYISRRTPEPSVVPAHPDNMAAADAAMGAKSPAERPKSTLYARNDKPHVIIN